MRNNLRLIEKFCLFFTLADFFTNFFENRTNENGKLTYDTFEHERYCVTGLEMLNIKGHRTHNPTIKISTSCP